MKTLLYVGLGFILLTLAYNFIFFDYEAGLFDAYNLPFVIGIGAGISAFLLLIILINYRELRKHSTQRSAEESTSQSSDNPASSD